MTTTDDFDKLNDTTTYIASTRTASRLAFNRVAVQLAKLIEVRPSPQRLRHLDRRGQRVDAPALPGRACEDIESLGE